MRTLILVVVLASGVLAQSNRPARSMPREFYATPDYRGALATLDRLAATDPARPDRPV